MASILCPSGHRHGLPVLTAECWLDADEVRVVAVTRREFDVASALLRTGAGNAAIGRKLYLSEDTVKTHMKSLLQRTGATTRTELIVAVFRGRIQLVAVDQAASLMWSASKQPIVT